MAVHAELTTKEYCAVALIEAAEALSRANDADRFLSAIETNHCLWSMLTQRARPASGRIDKRTADFVMSMTYRAGRGICDRDVEILIELNRGLSASLAGGEDLAAVRRRAVQAWKDAAPLNVDLGVWLMAEIDRGSRMAVSDAA